MIKILIIEDEIPARKKLKRFLDELDTATDVVGEIDTVRKAVDFLTNTKVDLIISDIELLDGNAFEIYKEIAVTCPIIFTTAYDQFLMDAFETNGIEYLLKPFSRERFQKAWNKFLQFRNTDSENDTLLMNLTRLMENNLVEKSYKKRFTINYHQGIYFLETENIAFFQADEGVVFAIDTSGKKHILTESTLTKIEAQLNPAEFFRINRSELVGKKYIEKIERYAKNSLAIKMKGSGVSLKTSQSTTSSFREWVEK
jgi:DNA-binding LytR/AlgR family response regulator